MELAGIVEVGNVAVEGKLASGVGMGECLKEEAAEQTGQDLDGGSQMPLPVFHSPLSTSKPAWGATTWR